MRIPKSGPGILQSSLSAKSVSDISSESDIRAVERGTYSIMYGSPESWLGETRW